ncbi:MAG: ferrous iron transport protein A [Phycisphaerae bacterium]|nr:ferrous iron transport protein A [Phycisphaerae bacterium]
MNAENNNSSGPVIPLTMTLVGQQVTFAGVRNAGAGLTHRLAEMGLTPGEKMEIINRGDGPFIVSVKGSRFVLGRGMVHRIMVRPE